ncbi:MAG TPA: hypothetical protein VK518_15145 [Puia sp.]|nr:hypothetical protein [Puia sp.]
MKTLNTLCCLLLAAALLAPACYKEEQPIPVTINLTWNFPGGDPASPAILRGERSERD